MSQPTMGKILQDTQQANAGIIHDPYEIQRAHEKEYLENLEWCVKHALKEVDCIKKCEESCKSRSKMEGDFYVVVLLKKEKALEGVFRTYFIASLSCPTPHFDQTVYKYNSHKGTIEFLWVVPDKYLCQEFREFKDECHPEQHALLNYVLSYYSGELYQLSKRLNGESIYAGGALKNRIEG